MIALPGGRHGDRELPPGPKAQGKWLAGAVRKDPGEVITAMFDEAEARDPGHRGFLAWAALPGVRCHTLAMCQVMSGSEQSRPSWEPRSAGRSAIS